MLLRFTFAAALSAALLVPAHAAAADTDIRLSSVGFLPLRAKLASVIGSATSFNVVRDSDGAVVSTGALTGPVSDQDTGESVLIADFSALADPGIYHLEVDGVGRSVSFPIDPDVYRTAFNTSMLGFYGWRCGTAVSFDYAGTHFGYPACHLQDGHTDPLGTVGVRDGVGGWHDAGDYGKYTVNSAFTLGMLLAAWEDFQPALEPVTLAIPETGGALPDYLDELKWELVWLLKMQYSATDGRVAHKITETSHPGFISPEADTSVRSFVPYGTPATADFVGALAKASRIYRPYDPAFADQCLAAARVSYDYLVANPAQVAANEMGFIGTQYSGMDADDRIWAAAEMWEATGDPAALADFETRISAEQEKVSLDFDWGNVKNLGTFTYIASQREGRSDQLVSDLKTLLGWTADTLVSNRKRLGYGRALSNYYWGVNGSIARTCMLLQRAYRLKPNSDYLDTCTDQLGYLFGRNAYDRSFVTGLGLNPPMHPHHRPSAADAIEQPYPGLLVGGGWVFRAIAGPPEIPACTSPAGLCWADDQANYSTNEVAINWNAALVYALAGFVGGGPQVPTGTGAVGVAGNAGVAGGGAGSPSETGSGGSDDGDSSHSSKGGCGCTVPHTVAHAPTWLTLLTIGLLIGRRARRFRTQ